MFRSWFLGNPFGRSCFALAQTFETKFHTEEVTKKLANKAQNVFLKKFLLVQIIPQSATVRAVVTTAFEIRNP